MLRTFFEGLATGIVFVLFCAVFFEIFIWWVTGEPFILAGKLWE